MEPRASGLLGQCSILSYILLLSVRTAICPHPLLTMASTISGMPLGNQKPQSHTSPSVLTAFSHKLLDHIACQQSSLFTPCSLPRSLVCGVDSQDRCGSCTSGDSAETPSAKTPKPDASILNSAEKCSECFPPPHPHCGLTSNYLLEAAGFAFGPNIKLVPKAVHSFLIWTMPTGHHSQCIPESVWLTELSH